MHCKHLYLQKIAKKYNLLTKQTTLIDFCRGPVGLRTILRCIAFKFNLISATVIVLTENWLDKILRRELQDGAVA